jgi:tetratricopeptide (TPR) repeat protein
VNKTQIAVISGSVVLIVLLLFANTKPPAKEVPAGTSEHASHSGSEINDMVATAKAALSPSQRKSFENLEAALNTSADKKLAYERIIDQWDSIRQPAIAAYYMEQAAKASSSAKNWFEAGNRYYAATRFVKEEERHILFGKAMECYEKTLQAEPNNIEAKISLAACYVEGSSEPMKGIGMLKEIEKTDSNNVNLQLNFAFFSERSGQWDKAIARFKKVLEINPEFIEAYLHLADAYQQMGDKNKTIESLEKYIALEKDVTIKAEIQDYINKLKTN